MSQGLSGVRQAAKKRKQERFTALLHHVTVTLLRDSFYALKRQLQRLFVGVPTGSQPAPGAGRAGSGNPDEVGDLGVSFADIRALLP